MSFLFAKYKQVKRVTGYTDQTGSTHTSMRGGCLTVLPEKRKEFFDDYFAAFKRGELLAWTERIPLKDPFKFLVDIDFPHGDEFVPLGTLQTDLEEIVYKLCEGITDADAPEELPWSCCFGTRCPNKLHAHFPNLIVDRKNAVLVARRVMAFLKKKYTTINARKWNKIIDLSIYEGGIRLLGSRKSQAAEDKEQKGEEERLGKENVGKIPLLYKMTLPDGSQVQFERSHLDLCTILADPDAELTPLPGLYEDEDEEDGADGSDEETAVERRPKKIRKKTTKKARPQSESDGEEDDETNRVEIPKDVRQEISRVAGMETDHLRYGKMGADSIEIVTHSPDCPFSESGGHKSNHQRLFVSAHSVVQKCHSKKCVKEKRVLKCPKAAAWFLSFFRDEIDSPAIDKKVLGMLYDEEKKYHNQAGLTEYLNRFVAYINGNDSYATRTDDSQNFDMCRKATAANRLERLEFGKGVAPFDVWCKNSTRREFAQVVFDTSDKKHPPSTLNLFRGYKAKMLDRKVSADEVETFLYHLREVLCCGDSKNFDFLEKWWAHFFQKGKTGIMVILVSLLKGTGKNLILELLAQYVIGDQYVATTDKLDTIVQKFNAINIEKALIVANELQDASKSAKENNHASEVLKSLVKDRTMTIEKKSIDPLTVPSTTNYIGTTNNAIPLKIDRDQRRFFVLDVSDHKKGDKAYFSELAEFVKTHADEIFTYLNQIDLTGWDPEFDLIQTKFTKRVQRAFVGAIYRFWADIGYAEHDFDKMPLKKKDIFKQFLGWGRDNNVAAVAKTSDEGFGKQVVAMGYKLDRRQVYGEREKYITGKMSDATREIVSDN